MNERLSKPCFNFHKSVRLYIKPVLFLWAVRISSSVSQKHKIAKADRVLFPVSQLYLAVISLQIKFSILLAFCNSSVLLSSKEPTQSFHRLYESLLLRHNETAKPLRRIKILGIEIGFSAISRKAILPNTIPGIQIFQIL